jgi:hypothetical protein
VPVVYVGCCMTQCGIALRTKRESKSGGVCCGHRPCRGGPAGRWHRILLLNDLIGTDGCCQVPLLDRCKRRGCPWG